MNEETSLQRFSLAVFIQESSGEVRAPGNCQLSGPRKAMVSFDGKKKERWREVITQPEMCGSFTV